MVIRETVRAWGVGARNIPACPSCETKRLTTVRSRLVATDHNEESVPNLVNSETVFCRWLHDSGLTSWGGSTILSEAGRPQTGFAR